MRGTSRPSTKYGLRCRSHSRSLLALRQTIRSLCVECGAHRIADAHRHSRLFVQPCRLYVLEDVECGRFGGRFCRFTPRNGRSARVAAGRRRTQPALPWLATINAAGPMIWLASSQISPKGNAVWRRRRLASVRRLRPLPRRRVPKRRCSQCRLQERARAAAIRSFHRA